MQRIWVELVWRLKRTRLKRVKRMGYKLNVAACLQDKT